MEKKFRKIHKDIPSGLYRKISKKITENLFKK